MLIQFSVTNFMVFKDQTILSMMANSDHTQEDDNTILDSKFNLRLLKSAVIYGANASGKTKIFKALEFMKKFVISSSKGSQIGDKINVDPFKLSTITENEPSEFEVIFLYNDIIYRYGFECNESDVISEWLFYKKNKKDIQLFYRDEQDIEVHTDYKKGGLIKREGLLRNNVLLLSLAAQFNDEISIQVINWFNKLLFISGIDHGNYEGFTLMNLKNPKLRNKIIDLTRFADFGIDDVKLKKIDKNELPLDMPVELRDLLLKEVKKESSEIVMGALTKHKKFDENGKVVQDLFFSMDDEESSGTNKFFALSGPISSILDTGSILCVDELDSKLHPLLVSKIVSLFNSNLTNANKAQLVFNTHNTYLLRTGLFRRDQVWFTKKNMYGAASLYPLSDFSPRKEEALENNYLNGKYGGIPYLKDIVNAFLNDKHTSKNEE